MKKRQCPHLWAFAAIRLQKKQIPQPRSWDFSLQPVAAYWVSGSTMSLKVWQNVLYIWLLMKWTQQCSISLEAFSCPSSRFLSFSSSWLGHCLCFYSLGLLFAWWLVLVCRAFESSWSPTHTFWVSNIPQYFQECLEGFRRLPQTWAVAQISRDTLLKTLLEVRLLPWTTKNDCMHFLCSV